MNEQLTAITYICPVCQVELGDITSTDERIADLQREMVDLRTELHAKETGHDENARFAAQHARRPEFPLLAGMAEFTWLDATAKQLEQAQRELTGARDVRITLTTLYHDDVEGVA